MTNMTKDYYKILGVAELCTEQELKSAYRKLARKWHPDIAGNTEYVVNKFKEINEAYETLSDKNKRADYDTIRRYSYYSSSPEDNRDKKDNNENKTNTTTNPNTQNKKTAKDESKAENEQNNFGFGFKWDEFIAKYKEYTNKYEGMHSKTQKESSDKKAKYGNSQKGNNINTDVEITIAEAISGTTKVINMLHTSLCPKCGGRKFVNGCICTHCNGKGEKAEHKRFTVKIPAGVKDNSKIRLAGEGEKGLNGGENGDLYITVHIKAPIDYKTEGNNILKTITLAPYEAVLGGNVTVKTLDGNINVKITPNTQNGQKIRLSGCGINKSGKIGDMILTVEIQIPKNLLNLEIELYKKLQEVSSQTVR